MDINTYLNMLAKEHGRNLKLKSYLDGVKRFDRRDDLIQLLENVRILRRNLSLLRVKNKIYIINVNLFFL